MLINIIARNNLNTIIIIVIVITVVLVTIILLLLLALLLTLFYDYYDVHSLLKASRVLTGITEALNAENSRLLEKFRFKVKPYTPNSLRFLGLVLAHHQKNPPRRGSGPEYPKS